MKTAQRDLLLVSHGKWQSNQSFRQEVELLEKLLYTVENVQNVAKATEVFDINRYRIHRKPNDVVRMLLKKENRGFVFFINHN
jgi:hypothetical protein